MNDMTEWLNEGNLIFQYKIMEGEEHLDHEKVPKVPLLILTCMDPRIDVHRIFQLNQGDAFVLRNAGNVLTDDMLRSIILAVKNYGVKHVVILGHVDCGVAKIDAERLKERLSHDFFESHGGGYVPIQDVISFFKLEFKDEIENIRRQVSLLRDVPDIKSEVEVLGMLYDVYTGGVIGGKTLKVMKNVLTLDRFRKKILADKREELSRFLKENYSQDLDPEEKQELQGSPDQEELHEPKEGLFRLLKEKYQEHGIEEKIPDSGFPDVKAFKINLPKSKVRIPGVKKRNGSEP